MIGPESGECESDPEQQRLAGSRAPPRRDRQHQERREQPRPRHRPPRVLPPTPSPPRAAQPPQRPERPPTPKTELIQSPEVSPIESDEEEDVGINEACDGAILDNLRTESVSPAPLAPNDDEEDGVGTGQGQVEVGKKIKKKKGKKDKKEKRKLKKKKRRESLAQQQQQLEQDQAQQQVQSEQPGERGTEDQQAAFGSPLSSDPDFKQSPVVDISNRGTELSNGGMAKAAQHSHRPSGPHTPPPPPARRPPRTPPEPPTEDGDNSPGTPVYNESGPLAGKRQPQTPPEPEPEPSDLPIFRKGRTLQEMLASGKKSRQVRSTHYLKDLLVFSSKAKTFLSRNA